VVAILLICLTIFGALWTWSIIRRKGPDLSTPLDAGMITILAAVIISAFFSLDPSRSLRAAVNWFALIIVYYMAVSAFRSGWRISIFERALLLILGLIVLTAYLQLFFWLQNTYFASAEEALPPSSLIRVSGIINNPNSFAVLLNVGIMVALGSKISLQQRRWPVAILLWLILTAPLVVLHGSRNGWLSTIFGFACLSTTWYLWRAGGQRIGRSSWLRIGLITLGAALVSLLLVMLIRPTTINFDEVSGYATRATFWRIALATWRQNPLSTD
jgi:O-antigen ligase